MNKFRRFLGLGLLGVMLATSVPTFASPQGNGKKGGKKKGGKAGKGSQKKGGRGGSK